MQRGFRYHQLAERNSLDLVREVERVFSDWANTGAFSANVLDFKGFDECFYNAGVRLPLRTPEDLADPDTAEHPEDRELAALLRVSLIANRVEVHSALRYLKTLIEEGEWLPALLSPELEELADLWIDWFLRDAERPLEALSRAENVRWQAFGRFLLNCLPQPVRAREDSAAFAIYSKVTGVDAVLTRPLDEDGFLRVSPHAYRWAFDERGAEFDHLRAVLELAFLVPLPLEDRRALLRLRIGGRSNFNFMAVEERPPESARLTALGGPMIYHGQLEGVLYVAAHLGDGQEPFDEKANRALKELARDWASRRHRLRDAVVRDILLREVQSRGDVCPEFLVLEQIPKLLSVSVAVCVRYESTPAGHRDSGRLISRSPQPNGRRRMGHTASPTAEERVVFSRLREVLDCLSSGAATCLSATDSSARSLLDALAQVSHAKHAVSQARSVCIFSIASSDPDDDGRPEWAFALVFPHPTVLGSSSSLELSLRTSVRQIQLELESLIDFVRRATEAHSVGLVLAQTAHAMEGPVSNASQFTEFADTAFREQRFDVAAEYLANARVSLEHLSVAGRAAKQFFATRERFVEQQVIQVDRLARELTQLLDAAEPNRAFEFSLICRDELGYMAIADPGLCEIILWQMLANAVSATRRAAMHEPQRDDLEILLCLEDRALAPLEPSEGLVTSRGEVRPESIVITVTNPVSALEATEADLNMIGSKAQQRLWNAPKTSGGTGLGLLYCYDMASRMRGAFNFYSSSQAPLRAGARLTLPAAPLQSEV